MKWREGKGFSGSARLPLDLAETPPQNYLATPCGPKAKKKLVTAGFDIGNSSSPSARRNLYEDFKKCTQEPMQNLQDQVPQTCTCGRMTQPLMEPALNLEQSRSIEPVVNF